MESLFRQYPEERKFSVVGICQVNEPEGQLAKVLMKILLLISCNKYPGLIYNLWDSPYKICPGELLWTVN